MKKLIFAFLLVAMVFPAFAVVNPKIQYCECTGIGMPHDTNVINSVKSANHKNPLEVYVLRMEIWMIYLLHM